VAPTGTDVPWLITPTPSPLPPSSPSRKLLRTWSAEIEGRRQAAEFFRRRRRAALAFVSGDLVAADRAAPSPCAPHAPRSSPAPRARHLVAGAAKTRAAPPPRRSFAARLPRRLDRAAPPPAAANSSTRGVIVGCFFSFFLFV